MSQTGTAATLPADPSTLPGFLEIGPGGTDGHEPGAVTDPGPRDGALDAHEDEEETSPLSPSQLLAIECLVSREPGESMEAVAARAKISRRTLYRYLKEPAFADEYRQRLALTASTDRGRMLRALVEAGLKPGPGQASCQRLFWQLQGDVRDLVSLEVSGPEGGPVQVETEARRDVEYVSEEAIHWLMAETVNRNTSHGNPSAPLWWASPELRALARAELKLDMMNEPRKHEVLRESTRQAIMRDLARANAINRHHLEQWKKKTAELGADYAEKYRARSGGHDLPAKRNMCGDPGEHGDKAAFYAQVLIEHHLKPEGIELYLDSTGNIQARPPEARDEYIDLKIETHHDGIIEYLKGRKV